ncbi:hypothetical protein RI129_013038 [Pyrocoelia pectoralis]|uniref:COMM domain-containing protein 3 n=1 Tax=Pyrocoelia pectoralis TaxID=417401 RepID=A0AAN7V0T0_9COLE
MNIKEELRNRVKFIGNCTVNDDIFKKLVENGFSTLTRKPETHSLSTLYNSKPDLIKEVYAIIMTITAEFARHDLSKEEITQFLVDSNFSTNRSALFVELYEKNKRDLQIALGNIGSHPPHIVDVEWKIDYIVKASNLDRSDGPIFRIALSTSKFDESVKGKSVERVYFTCNSRELQDLVYKLKDAVRHCQRLTSE